MARRPFVRRFNPGRPSTNVWLVLIGTECAEERTVIWPTPDEQYVRRLFQIPEDTPILIGRP
jgi:hypothetical protein